MVQFRRYRVAWGVTCVMFRYKVRLEPMRQNNKLIGIARSPSIGILLGWFCRLLTAPSSNRPKLVGERRCALPLLKERTDLPL